MLLAKGAGSVDVSKVKGHATDEAVAEGTVKQRDKDGNDFADTGAAQGSVKAQQRLADLTGLYSYRNEAYRCVVERIQNFILKMKNMR